VWHGLELGRPDFGGDSRALALQLLAVGGGSRSIAPGEGLDVVGQADHDLYIAANAHWEPKVFALPALPLGRTWHRFVDTSRASPEDAALPGAEPRHETPDRYVLGPRSVVVLVGR
jgi:glycogen operon protein